MESSTGVDLSTLFRIEEEETQASPVLSEENYALGAEGWETPYAIDVLIASGLQESDINMFTTSWYSTTGTRLERKLLFDRINFALLQIFGEHFDSCLWVNPKLMGSSLKWQRRVVIDSVEKLIMDQEMLNVEISDKVVDREMLWSDPKGEIGMIGNEIERLLIDDMILEVMCK